MPDKKPAKAKTAAKKAKRAVKEAEVLADATPIEPEVAEVKPEVVAETKTAKTTKAGKHSAKALKEAEAEKAKAERKAKAKTDEKTEKPKPAKNPPRTRLERASKKFREVAKLVEADKLYSLSEAAELAVKTSPVKFDATIELHVNLSVDPKQADQNIRGTVVLPSGSGKTQRVTSVANDTEAKALFAELDKGKIDFDVLIATPEMMPQLGKYARILGPKGLMPNPKSGTVTKDIAKATEEAKTGKVEYRVDSNGIVHVGIGKVSFGADKIQANLEVLLAAIKSAKPSSVKANYIKSIYLTTSMGPSIKLDPVSV